MRDSLPEWMSDLLWRGAGATFVIGMALFCGRFVEEAAAERAALRAALQVPHQITPLSATTPEAAGDKLWFTRGPSQNPACEPGLTLQAKPGALLSVTLTAPCAANTRVEIRHGDLRFTKRMPAGRPLHFAFPALEASGAVRVILSEGSVIEAVAPLTDLVGYRRFALAWSGAEGFDIEAEEGARRISAEEPGAGPGTLAGWLVELGDAEDAGSLQAQVYTYPVSGLAEVTARLVSTPATCGQRLRGMTLSSQAGAVEVAALRVDLPDCAAGRVVLPLKNLDRGMKLALR